MWCVVRMNARTGDVNPVSRLQSCTPDWAGDSKHVIFSCRPPSQTTNNGYGWTQLYLSSGEGGDAQLLYGEDGSHIYGGALSPTTNIYCLRNAPKMAAGRKNRERPSV